MEFIEFTEDKFQSLKTDLAKRQRLPIRIMSASMEPLIKTDELIQIRPLSRPIQKFDILVFWWNRRFICHFVSALNQVDWNEGQRRVVTQSLQSRGEDFPFPEQFILGIVEGKTIPLLYRLRFELKRLWKAWRNR